MPLHDHFHPPLSRTHPWRGFHGAWAAAIARGLNQGVLPPGYYSLPFVDRAGPVEIDVAALDGVMPGAEPGGIDGPRPWIPPAPGMTVLVDLPEADDVRVEVFADDGDPRLAAAIELVSPRNKDRPGARRAFLAKCAGYLRLGCGVVVVVTTRRADLHAELLATLGVEVLAPSPGAGPSVVAYRAVGRDDRTRLLAWPTPIGLGQPLPTPPLWLASDLAVPLDLEASYRAACADLRIPHPG